MNTWFTGCTHFNHERIIKLAKRPFDSVEQMNETLIDNWNKVVKPDDMVYHLGDISWPTANDKRDSDPERWLSRLNGKKVIIWGNHDDRSQTITWFKHDYLELKIDKQAFVLFHYPIEDWNGRWKGSIHLHAHDHIPVFRNHLPPLEVTSGLDLGPAPRYPADLKCNRFRVGMDACNFRPVHLDEIMTEAKREG